MPEQLSLALRGALLYTWVGWRYRMSPQFPRPSIRLYHKSKGSNPQPGECTQRSDPAYLQLCPSPLLLPAGEVGTAGPQETYPKERLTNDRLAVARSPASSLSLNQVPLQTGILLTVALGMTFGSAASFSARTKMRPMMTVDLWLGQGHVPSQPFSGSQLLLRQPCPPPHSLYGSWSEL